MRSLLDLILHRIITRLAGCTPFLRHLGLDSLKTGMQAALAALNLGGGKPTDKQYEQARRQADTAAKVAFLESGGKAEEFARSRREAARGEVLTSMADCMGNERDSKGKSNKNARSSCDAAAKEAFQLAGGRGSDFRAEVRKGARDLAADSLKDCIQTAVGGARRATPQQYAAARKGCLATAKASFTSVSGNEDALAFERSFRAGARKKMRDEPVDVSPSTFTEWSSEWSTDLHRTLSSLDQRQCTASQRLCS